MDDSQARKFQKDLNTGLVALVLLAVLEHTQEDLYGYEIAKRLQKANQGEALFKEGTVYPVLRTLAAGRSQDRILRSSRMRCTTPRSICARRSRRTRTSPRATCSSSSRAPTVPRAKWRRRTGTPKRR